MSLEEGVREEALGHLSEPRLGEREEHLWQWVKVGSVDVVFMDGGSGGCGMWPDGGGGEGGSWMVVWTVEAGGGGLMGGAGKCTNNWRVRQCPHFN